MNSAAIISWFSSELEDKKIKVESLKDLKSGSLFLELLHIYFPRSVDLTKVYIKPKNSFEVSQNYRQLANICSQLGWKKVDPEKYVKQQDKDCIDISNTFIKRINSIKASKGLNQTSQLGQTMMSFDFALDKTVGEEGDDLDLQIEDLERRKEIILGKIMKIENCVHESTDEQTMRRIIWKIIDH